MHGEFTWNELASTNPESAMAFYSETLGWTFDEFPIPEGAYWVAKSNGKLVGGLGGLRTGAVRSESSYWFSFIEVDDVDVRVSLAAERGATILTAPMDVPDVGRVAVLRDPTGAVVGWMTPIQPG